MRQATLIAAVLGLMAVVVPSVALADPTVPSGYSIEVWFKDANVAQDPMALAFAPDGNFGYAGQLFVSYFGANKAVWRVMGKDKAVKFSDTPSAHECLAFPAPGAGFGERLYGPMVDTIYSYESNGARNVFANVGASELCGFAFGPGGRWGQKMYVLSSAGPDQVRVYDSNGSSRTLITNLPENEKSMAFSPGGDWGDYLYLGAWAFGGQPAAIRRVDPNGVLTDFLVGPTYFGTNALINMSFGTSGPFQDKLYVSAWGDQKIYEIDAKGNVSTFATGFAFPGTRSGDIAFGPDGAMYVADEGSETVWRITPEPATLVLLAAGGVALLRRRRR